MSKVLKQDSEVLVTLEDSGLVKKIVYEIKPFNGFALFSSPKKSVDREIRALEMLSDVEGIQRFVKRESDVCFYSELVEGFALSGLSPPISDSYFSGLDGVVRDCHKNGVFRIGQSRDDFFVSNNNKPFIVDFGNVLFADDTIAKVPGVLEFVRKYNLLRVADLRRRYCVVPQQSLYSLD